MHFCPHCIQQTLLWVLGLASSLPFLGMLFKNKIKSYICKNKCKQNHTLDFHVHK